MKLTSMALTALLLAGPTWAAKPLVYCADADPDSFDSAQSDVGATHRAAAYPLYNRLVEFRPGNVEAVPSLAESWNVSADGKRYTFKLRSGVKFHQTPWFTPSRDLDADDVIWSVMRQIDAKHPGAKAAAGGFPGAVSGNWAGLIQKVEKLDPLTVRFELARPNATFLALMANWQMSIVSAEYGERLAQEGKETQIGRLPVGTGPYRFINYQKGNNIRYAAHPHYFKGVVAIDKLVYAIVPDPAVRVEKLRVGECGLVESLKPQDIASFQTVPTVGMKRIYPQITVYLAFNTQSKPFDDARVRRALSMVVDRPAISKAVFDGRADPAWLPYSGKTLWGAANIKAPARDYEAAKKLLAEAGYPAGFETTIWVRGNGGAYNLNPKLMGEMVQADWQKLGIKAKVVPMDFADMLRRTRQGEQATVLTGWMNSVDPDELYANTLSCEASKTSSSRWCNSRFDQLIEEARTIPNRAQREKLYAEAQAIFDHEAPWAALVYPALVLGYDKALQGVDNTLAAPFMLERLYWK